MEILEILYVNFKSLSNEKSTTLSEETYTVMAFSLDGPGIDYKSGILLGFTTVVIVL